MGVRICVTNRERIAMKRMRWLVAGSAMVLLLLVGGWPAKFPPGTVGKSLSTPALSAQQHIPIITPPSTSQLEAFRSKIQHIVYILKENRSFDNFFGTYPGADGATSGVTSTGERIDL